METKASNNNLRIMIEVFIVIFVLATPLLIIAWNAKQRSSPYVFVTIRNTYTSPIISGILSHDKVELSIGKIAPGGSIKLRFDPKQTQSFYNLDVRFKDGKSISGGGDYVESGYMMTEIVTAKDIKTKRRIPELFGNTELRAISSWIYGIVVVVMWRFIKYLIWLRKQRGSKT